MAVLTFTPGFRIFYNGSSIFQTEPIRKAAEGKAGAPEVAKFPGAVKGRGIIINVTVDVFLIGMGGYKKGVFSFRPPHSQFIAHPVRFFGGNLARIKRLPYLIAQYITCFFLLPSSHNSITGLCQKELVRHRSRITFISRNIFSLFCFFRIFPVVQTVPDCLGNGFSLAGMTL